MLSIRSPYAIVELGAVEIDDDDEENDGEAGHRLFVCKSY
jgi:hypothetical protein